MIAPNIPHTDIMLDAAYDLVIDPVKGDFVVARSQSQEAGLIMKYQQGTLRSSPLTGVGIDSYLNADVDANTIKNLESLIQQQFEMDDKTINDIEYTMSLSDQLLTVNIDFDQNQ